MSRLKQNLVLEKFKITCIKATCENLEKIWNKDIARNLGEECWMRWKGQYINYNKTGKATTFVVLDENEVI